MVQIHVPKTTNHFLYYEILRCDELIDISMSLISSYEIKIVLYTISKYNIKNNWAK